MLSFALLTGILIEIGGYLAFGRLALELAWQFSALFALGAALALRALIIGFTWIFSRYHASPSPALRPSQWLKMILEEYLAFLQIFLFVIPFERLWMPADQLMPCRRPILLVHGYGCSRGVWWRVRRELEAAGHTVATVSLFPPYTSIGRLVPQLAQRIDEVCVATGAQQLVLIGHSMGGLVCRSYLARYGIGKVSRLITLATPHQGSQLARYGIGRNTREMEPGSLWLRDLAHDPIRIPCVAVRTSHDNYVMPQDNQRLPGARDVEMVGIGHIALLSSARTTPLLLDCLAWDC